MIKNLAQIAYHADKYKKPFGGNTILAIVTDATRPLYREKQGNYIVMLKLIDETLNDDKLFGVMSKDLTVYVISKNKKEIDLVKGIGEIVLLDMFSFSLWNDIKLQAKYQGTMQGIYIVQSDPQNINNFKVLKTLSMNPNLQRIEPSSMSLISQRLRNLQNWRNTKMNSIYNPKLGVRILNNHCVMIQPFNMILKVVEVTEIIRDLIPKKMKQELENEKYRIKFTDYCGNIYFILFYRGDFEIGEFVFIRGMKTIGQSLQIILTGPGNILKIKYPIQAVTMNYMAIHRDNQKFTVDKQHNQFTVINCQNMEPTYLWDLVQLQDKYDHQIKKQDILVKDAYLVEAIAINYEGSLKMYHRDFQILLHQEFYEELTPDQKKECKEFNKIGYVYQGMLGLIDRSNQAKGNPFYAHLFTCDAQGNFLTPEDFQIAEKAIGSLDQVNRRNDLEKLINLKLQKLTDQSDFQRPVSLVLQPIRSERLLFRITNTKFI